MYTSTDDANTGKSTTSNVTAKNSSVIASRPKKKARPLPMARSGRVGSARTARGEAGTSRPFTAEEQADITCKCSKTKCLKLYCDCFQAGAVCKDDCACVNCKNTKANSGPNGSRTAAVRAILARRPDAFQLRVKETGQGCKCKLN